MSAIWLFVFNMFPDMYKGMLKGIIMALGIQYKCVYVHIVTHWMIYPTGVWYFAFHRQMGVVGIWTAKIILEWSIFTLYTILINC